MFIVSCFNIRVMCERSVHVDCVLFQYKGDCERSIHVYCVLFLYKGDV